MRTRFANRAEAGRAVAASLSAYAGRDDVIVLALPRGGVPVAAEIAAALDAPFDVFLVRKLGVPGQPELAMGAIAEGGTTVLNDDLIDSLGTSVEMVERVRARELQELERRQRLYRGVRPRPDVHDRTVILVDDGLATGASMEAAVGALRAMGPARVVVAVPVGARESCARMAALADEVICAQMPEHFAAVGQWYADFSETSDEEVSALLSGA
jgi:predicted phosphoribosyltransferase